MTDEQRAALVAAHEKLSEVETVLVAVRLDKDRAFEALYASRYVARRDLIGIGVTPLSTEAEQAVAINRLIDCRVVVVFAEARHRQAEAAWNHALAACAPVAK